MKIDDEEEEQSTFVVQLLNIKRNAEELQEKEEQPFPDCPMGREKGGRIKKKRAKRKEDQDLAVKEEGKKKKLRKFTKKTSRKQGMV